MESVFDPEAGRYVRAPEPPARRSNPAIPAPPEAEQVQATGPVPPPEPRGPGVPVPRVPAEGVSAEGVPAEGGAPRPGRHRPADARDGGRTRRWPAGILVALAVVAGVALAALGQEPADGATVTGPPAAASPPAGR